MAALTCYETIEIEAPLKVVKQQIVDFNNWPKWSPWLVCEPDAELSFSGDPGEIGHSYSWAGELTGEGSVTLKHVTDSQVDVDLVFLKPYKSKAAVQFTLSQSGETTTVSWSLDSKLPFFLFFMAKKMSAMIAMDYRRGLLMLKDVCESGSAATAPQIAGESNLPAGRYVAVSGSAKLEDMAKVMQPAIAKLASHVADHEVEPNGPMCSCYSSMDFEKRSMDFKVMFPVPDDAELKLGDGVEEVNLDARKSVKVNHLGAYKHVGNGWAAAAMYMRHKKVGKPSADISGVEIYMNNPEMTPEAELMTQIHMFTK